VPGVLIPYDSSILLNKFFKPDAPLACPVLALISTEGDDLF
jgi:hypothetical protein